MYNNIQLSYKKMWVQPIDQFMAHIEAFPVDNKIYDEKRLKMLSGLKNFFTNYIIKPEGYDYVSLLSVANILKRMAIGLPLYEISDIPEEWSPIIFENKEKEVITYQALRYSSLFKMINTRTGEITFQDINQFEGTYKNRRYVHFHSGLINRVLRPLYPITMPYHPHEDHIKVTTEDFLVDPRNGDFDTMGLFYAEDPYSGIKKINRFFKESKKSDFGWKEISHLEYLFRKLIQIDSNSERANRIRMRHRPFLYKKMNIQEVGEEIHARCDVLKNPDWTKDEEDA